MGVELTTGEYEDGRIHLSLTVEQDEAEDYIGPFAHSAYHLARDFMSGNLIWPTVDEPVDPYEH